MTARLSIHAAVNVNVGARAHRRSACLLLGVIGLAACSLQTYVPAPPDAARIPRAFDAASLPSPAQSPLLLAHGADRAGWSSRSLGLLAADRSLAVTAACSEVDAARARQRLAVQRQNPQLNVGLERHSEEQEFSRSLWSIGPSINLTLVPPAVRRLKGERAALDVALARLAAIESAWIARNTAVDAALAVLDHQREAQRLQRVARRRDEAVAAARSLVAAGVADAFEWQTMMLDRNDDRLARLTRTAAAATARAELAAALTLPLAAIESLVLTDDLTLTLPAHADLQAAALNVHPAVLRALTVHAQAERDLALAIAAQYPSIDLSPGYFFDQGDHVWSLLGGIVVPVFASHDAAIASAAAARDAAAAAVYATQAEVIATLQRAHARWRTATTILAEARSIVGEVRRGHAELATKLAEGIGDSLMVARAALQAEEAGLQLAAAAAEERHARAGIVAAARIAALDPPFAHWLETLAASPPQEIASP